MPSEPPANPTESKAGGGADPATTDRAAAIAAASRAIEISESTTRDSATNRAKPVPSTMTMSGSPQQETSAPEADAAPMKRRICTRTDGATSEGHTSHFQSEAGSRMRC